MINLALVVTKNVDIDTIWEETIGILREAIQEERLDFNAVFETTPLFPVSISFVSDSENERLIDGKIIPSVHPAAIIDVIWNSLLKLYPGILVENLGNVALTIFEVPKYDYDKDNLDYFIFDFDNDKRNLRNILTFVENLQEFGTIIPGVVEITSSLLLCYIYYKNIYARLGNYDLIEFWTKYTLSDRQPDGIAIIPTVGYYFTYRTPEQLSDKNITVQPQKKEITFELEIKINKFIERMIEYFRKRHELTMRIKSRKEEWDDLLDLKEVIKRDYSVFSRMDFNGTDLEEKSTKIRNLFRRFFTETINFSKSEKQKLIDSLPRSPKRIFE